MKNILALTALTVAFSMNAQVGIGTETPNAAAELEISSKTKGFLPPRMTSFQRNAISSPPQGLVIYCTDCGAGGQLQTFNGTIYTNSIGGERLLGTLWSNRLGNDIDGEAAGDLSGNSVSMSSDGTILAVGATQNDGGGSLRGHVKVYEYSGGAWVQLGIDVDGEADGDQSGSSLSLSSDGTTLAVGAPKNDGTGSNAGHVKVYKYIGGSWGQYGGDIDGEATEDRSGRSVSLSSDGTILAVGANKNGGNGSNAGHVKVYEHKGGAWGQIGIDIDGDAAGDKSGLAVSLSSDGTILAVGATQNDGGGTLRGHVKVYKYDISSSPAWGQLGTDIDGEADNDKSGNSVSLSSDGTIIAVGAAQNAGGGTLRGHVKVYEYSGGVWGQLGADIDGETTDDQSGSSVSLSSDGTILAVGAERNAGGGTLRGHVRIYKYNGSAWSQLGTEIDGEANSDLSGNSVSMSSDGTILAVGAKLNDGNGADAGHVRVHTGGL